MADTRVQLEVEDWVRKAWMPQHFGVNFYRERLKIRSGGVFDFDAVSGDKKIVATVSTSGAKTAGGKFAVGKMLKIRSDMLFLMYREFPRLCRGGSSSLTFPGVHPETLRGEPPSTHQGETGWTSMKA